MAVVASLAMGLAVVSGPRLDLITVAFPLLVVAFFAVGTLVIARYVRTGEALSLLPLITGFYLLAFAAGSLYFRFPRTEGGTGALIGFRDTYTPEGLVLALGLALVGWAFFAAGFRAANVMKFCRELPRPRATGNYWLIILGLLVVGWLARLWAITHNLYFRYPAESGEVARGQFDTLVQITTNVPLVAFGIVFYRSMTIKAYRPWVWILLVVEIAYALPAGERSRFITIGLLIAVCRYYGSPKPFPWRKAGLGALVCILVVFPFGALYRGTTGGAEVYREDPAARIAETTEEFLSQRPDEAIRLGYEETVSRFSDVASLAVITTQGRAPYPRTAGETATDWAGAVVPRALLPNKSNPGTIGNEFGLAYGILNYDALGTSSIAMSQVGDLYGSFGWFGITILIALLGAVVRGIDEYFSDRRDNPLTLAIYGTMLGQFILGLETSVAVGLFQGMKEIFVYVVVSGAIVATVDLLTSSHRSPVAAAKA